MKKNNVLKIAGYSIVLILFAFFIEFCSFKSNTASGILCSRHITDAVKSTTASLLSITSCIVSVSYFFALGSILGLKLL